MEYMDYDGEDGDDENDLSDQKAKPNHMRMDWKSQWTKSDAQTSKDDSYSDS